MPAPPHNLPRSRRKLYRVWCTLFMGMFLPLEECYPLVCAVAVGQHHADEFPRLRAEIGGSGFKFLRSPGPFHAVLPLRDRQRLDIKRETPGLRAILLGTI